MFKTLFLAASLMPLSFHIALAAEPLDLVMKGDIILDGKLPIKGQKQKFAHGITTVLEGGGVMGRTDPRFDGHGAGMGVKLEHGNAIYQFEIRIEGDLVGSFNVGGHGLGFRIRPDQVWVGEAKAPDAERKPVKLTAGKWHVVTVTRVGTLGSMQIGDVVVRGEKPTLKPEIDALRFHIKGDPKGSVSFRNLKIWNAVKKPDSVKKT